MYLDKQGRITIPKNLFDLCFLDNSAKIGIYLTADSIYLDSIYNNSTDFKLLDITKFDNKNRIIINKRLSKSLGYDESNLIIYLQNNKIHISKQT